MGYFSLLEVPFMPGDFFTRLFFAQIACFVCVLGGFGEEFYVVLRLMSQAIIE
jgi:hypothetical protein